MADLDAAAEFLKAVAHPGRLFILDLLLQGERSVGQLEVALGLRQAAVSQQLARLRAFGLVRSRRQGKTILYALADARIAEQVGTICGLFRGDRATPQGQPRPR